MPHSSKCEICRKGKEYDQELLEEGLALLIGDLKGLSGVISNNLDIQLALELKKVLSNRVIGYLSAILTGASDNIN